MSENSSNYYEIRIYLLGDTGVGKKSISKKILAMNSSKTVAEDPQSTQLFVEKFTKKRVKLPDENDKFKSEKERQQEKEEMEQQYKMEMMKNKDRYAIFKTLKEFSFEGGNLAVNCFPIREGDEVLDEYDEGDGKQKKTYFSGFDKTLKDLSILLPANQRDDKNTLIHLFLFVFDLTSTVSLEKLDAYFSEIQNSIKFEEFGHIAVIGNKADKKHTVDNSRTEEEKQYYEDTFNEFMTKLPKGTKYYEISTSMLFNFDSFFIKLLKESILNEQEAAKNIDYDKMLKTLKVKPNFSQAKRGNILTEETPGVGTYNNHVYELPEDRAALIELMDKKSSGRFNKKIFVNKCGPLFCIKTESDKDKGKGKKLESEKDEKEVELKINKMFNMQKSDKVKEILNINKPGFTLGIKDGKYNLKQIRRDKKMEMSLKMSKMIEDDNKMHIKTEAEVIDKTKHYEENREKERQKALDKYHTIETDLKERHDLILSKNEEERKKMIDRVIEKDEKYSNIKKCNDEKRAISQEQSKIKTTKPLLEKFMTPGPNAYNVRKEIDLNKGFSFGPHEKLKNEKDIKKKQIYKPEPKFPMLESDFDVIIKNAKRINYSNQHFPDRFPKDKIQEKPDTSKIDNKLKKWTELRANSEKVKQLNAFLQDVKQNQENARQRRKIILEDRQIKLEDIAFKQEEKRWKQEMNRLKRFGDTEITTPSDLFDEPMKKIRYINYTQVEESSPKFSIKGRYDHGGVFEGRPPDTDATIIKERGSKILPPLPNIRAVKANLPAYSFGSAERFEDPYANTEFTRENENKMLFEDGIFKPEDHKSFLKSQVTMGTGPKVEIVKSNGVPGPGLFNFKGFADEVKEKGEKINEVRTQIRKREMELLKQKEIEKEQRLLEEQKLESNEEENNEQGSNEENNENKDGNNDKIKEENKESINIEENQKDDNQDNLEQKKEDELKANEITPIMEEEETKGNEQVNAEELNENKENIETDLKQDKENSNGEQAQEESKKESIEKVEEDKNEEQKE